MAMQFEPSTVPADLMETGSGAPLPEYQDAHIWAFREFIRNRKNRDEAGREWKPAVILTKLWELWRERPREDGIEVQFRAVHYQTIERLRGTGKKRWVEDRLLFILIARFLTAHSVRVIEPQHIRDIQDVAAKMSAFAPPSFTLPCEDSQRQHSIAVYEFIPEKDFNVTWYLALKLDESERAPAACAALLFCHAHMSVELGVYCFAFQEGFLREYGSEFSEYLWFQLKHDGRRLNLIARTFSTSAVSMPHVAEFNAMGSWPSYECGPCTSQSARDFARGYFKNFDGRL